jgi:hypothetical protein
MSRSSSAIRIVLVVGWLAAVGLAATAAERGVAELEQQTWDSATRGEAIEALAVRLQRTPEDHAARLAYARALSWEGRREDSLAQYDELLRDRPSEALLWRERAAVLRWDGRTEEAMASLQRSLEIDSDSAASRAELALLERDRGNLAAAQAAIDRARQLDPDDPAVIAASNEIDRIAASQAELKAVYSDESGDFRRASLLARGQGFPHPAVRLRGVAAWDRFMESGNDLDRYTLGGEARWDVGSGIQLDGSYGLQLPDGIRVNHIGSGAVLLEVPRLPFQLGLGGTQRSILDSARAYEDVAWLENVGSGGGSLAAIRRRLRLREGFVTLSGTPVAGGYLYLDSGFGSVSDGNDRTSVAAGVGYDVLDGWQDLGDFDAVLKYGYFRLAFDRAAFEYFSPRDFQVHSLGSELRWRFAADSVAGVLAGAALRSGSAAGYLAGAYLEAPLSDALWLETRFQRSDDTEFKITSGTLSLNGRF